MPTDLAANQEVSPHRLGAVGLDPHVGAVSARVIGVDRMPPGLDCKLRADCIRRTKWGKMLWACFRPTREAVPHLEAP